MSYYHAIINLEGSIKTISIVIAEEHALMRDETRRILESNPDLKVVGEPYDGEQAMDLLRRLRPDVAILDIRMPKPNGIEIVRQMNYYCPDTKALILTACDDNEYTIALMEAGAHGYLKRRKHWVGEDDGHQGRTRNR